MTECCGDAACWINTNNLTSGNVVISVSVASSQCPLMRKNQFARYWVRPWALLRRGDHPWKQLTWKECKVWQCILIKSISFAGNEHMETLLALETSNRDGCKGSEVNVGTNSPCGWKGKGLHVLSSQIFHEPSAGPDAVTAIFRQLL